MQETGAKRRDKTQEARRVCGGGGRECEKTALRMEDGCDLSGENGNRIPLYSFSRSHCFLHYEALVCPLILPLCNNPHLIIESSHPSSLDVSVWLESHPVIVAEHVSSVGKHPCAISVTHRGFKLNSKPHDGINHVANQSSKPSFILILITHLCGFVTQIECRPEAFNGEIKCWVNPDSNNNRNWKMSWSFCIEIGRLCLGAFPEDGNIFLW